MMVVSQWTWVKEGKRGSLDSDIKYIGNTVQLSPVATSKHFDHPKKKLHPHEAVTPPYPIPAPGSLTIWIYLWLSGYVICFIRFKDFFIVSYRTVTLWRDDREKKGWVPREANLIGVASVHRVPRQWLVWMVSQAPGHRSCTSCLVPGSRVWDLNKWDLSHGFSGPGERGPDMGGRWGRSLANCLRRQRERSFSFFYPHNIYFKYF